MKRFTSFLLPLSLIFSLNADAANYTQVQLGAGAMYFSLFERGKEFDDELKTEERTKPSVSLQISGQILENNKHFWFDMFAQQTAKSYAEFQEPGSDEVQTHEASLTILGLGGRAMLFTNTMLKPYVKGGYFTAKLGIEESFKNQTTAENETENTTISETGYYAGGGLMQRINNKNSLTFDYAAYKIDEIKNFQHNIQLGWVFHF